MFQITIMQDYEPIDIIETDCIICAVHDIKTNSYATIFYADCDDRVAARTLRAEMKNTADHLADEELLQIAISEGEIKEDFQSPCLNCPENNNAEWDERTCPLRDHCKKGVN